MQKLSEIYDLVRKGELKNGDTVTFVADVLTKKEADTWYSATLTDGKNILVKYFGRKAKKEISPLFDKLKINKTFVIKGILWCSEDRNKFCLDKLIFVSDNKALIYRLKYFKTGNILYKLYSYLESNSEKAANKFFVSNKEAIMNLLYAGEDIDKLVGFVCDYNIYKHHIANKEILSCLIKTNLIDGFGENLFMDFISCIFHDLDINKNPYCQEIKINVAKYLYEIIDEIPDDIINFVDDNGDNGINYLCYDDLLSPIIRKLLNRNVSFNCVNDVGLDSLGEAIRHCSRTIVSLIVNSGKAKVTDKHKMLAEKYFIEL